MVNVSSFEALQTGFAEMLSTAGINLLCVIINFIIHSLSGGYLKIDTESLVVMCQRTPVGRNCSGFSPSWTTVPMGVHRAYRQWWRSRMALVQAAFEGDLWGKLPGIRYLETPTSSVCTREMNSDCPLCLQFHTSWILTACFFDS